MPTHQGHETTISLEEVPTKKTVEVAFRLNGKNLGRLRFRRGHVEFFPESARQPRRWKTVDFVGLLKEL